MYSVSWSISKIARLSGWTTFILCLCCVILIGQAHKVTYATLSAGGRTQHKKAQAGYDANPYSGAHVWTIFTVPGTPGGQTKFHGQDLASKFRLAGTFFEYSEGVVEARKAVIDDLVKGTQLVVSERDELKDGIIVARIDRDRIVLRDRNGIEEEVWLSFRAHKPESRDHDGTASLSRWSANLSDTVSRFGGQQVGDQRWVFRRDRLIEYYQELRDDPERLLAVFDSLKPVYDDSKRITGYRLSIEGEPELFAAAGLVEGDVVRSVNFMEMRNRHRAEFLLSQFIRNEANAFIFDIERNGEKKRLVYEIR